MEEKQYKIHLANLKHSAQVAINTGTIESFEKCFIHLIKATKDKFDDSGVFYGKAFNVVIAEQFAEQLKKK